MAHQVPRHAFSENYYKRGRVQVALLAEVVAAWNCSAGARTGMFDASFDAEAFRNSTGTGGDYGALSEGVACHHLWIGYLTEAWQVGAAAQCCWHVILPAWSSVAAHACHKRPALLIMISVVQPKPFCGRLMSRAEADNMDELQELSRTLTVVHHHVLSVDVHHSQFDCSKAGMGLMLVQVASQRVGPDGRAELALLEGLLQRALSNDRALTQHPSAPGARFRLLLLALQHASHQRVRPTLADESVAGAVCVGILGRLSDVCIPCSALRSN